MTGTTKRLRQRANFASLISVSIDTTSVPVFSVVFLGLLSFGDWERTYGSGDELLLGEGAPRLFLFRLLVAFGEMSSIELELEVLSNLNPL